MGQVRGNTGGVDNIVESKLIDERTCFQQQRERLDIETLVISKLIECLPTRIPRERERHTWPIPPEAPRTTISRGSQISCISLSYPLLMKTILEHTCFDHLFYI